MMREHRTMLRRVPTAMAVCAISVALTAGSARAENLVFASDPSGSPLARESVGLCLEAAKTTDESKRDALLERGLAAAERAVKENDGDAKAHFAVFCNLGRQLESGGASLAGVTNVKRLSAEIDRALALQPNFIDAMTAKGSFLIKLPGLLGGDEDEGEALVRRAAQLAPNHPPARLELAKLLVEKGEKEQALAEAQKVIQLGGTAEEREARALTEELGS